MPREILFIGSLPPRSAPEVFSVLAKHVGKATPFYPDGEQAGWLMTTFGTLHQNAALEESGGKVPLNEEATFALTKYRLKYGLKAKDLVLQPFRTADAAIQSYQHFKRLKENGVIPADVRFQVTIPSAGLVVAALEMLPQESFPVVAKALSEQIDLIIQAIPAKELLIQFDLPNETTHEEYVRRPWAMNLPYYDQVRLEFEPGVEALGWIINQIPEEVEVGLHTCSAWHVNAECDQDNRAITEIANAYLNVSKRPLRYINIPIHPLQDKPSDFAPFRNLELKPGTVLSLGLINLSDGLDGARRRIEAAEKAGLYDFGVSFWCGLGNGMNVFAPHPFVQTASVDTLADVLNLHLQVAGL